jgi:hypothetical protein
MLLNGRANEALEAAFFNNARPLLTIEQQAKLLVVLPRLLRMGVWRRQSYGRP